MDATRLTADPSWLAIARAELGVREIPGPKSNPRVDEYLRATRLPLSGIADETPWCAAFVCWALGQAGIEHTRSAGARSYMRWGVPLQSPRLGCVVVLSRHSATNPRSGHVGFWVGASERGPLVLGGNQKDSVSIQSYPRDRVLSYRWPRAVALDALT